jgi:SAM-dependent methyltransferase
MSLLTPPRRYGREILEDPEIDDTLVVRSIGDVVRSNKFFHGTGAVLAELGSVFPKLGSEATLLDVGTGLGDIPEKARHAAKRHGISLQTIGFDAEYILVHTALPRLSHGVCGDARMLPFADNSIDVVTCSQVLHHFRDDDATALLREATRVARVAVVISDIRRSWAAAAGFWAVSFPLGFHPITRHDGVLSVMRGFTTTELTETIRTAVGIAPPVRRRLGWRVTTHWTPTKSYR